MTHREEQELKAYNEVIQSLKGLNAWTDHGEPLRMAQGVFEHLLYSKRGALMSTMTDKTLHKIMDWVPEGGG